jgi:hypothetical protein
MAHGAPAGGRGCLVTSSSPAPRVGKNCGEEPSRTTRAARKRLEESIETTLSSRVSRHQAELEAAIRHRSWTAHPL